MKVVKAAAEDVQFIIETIIEAEKSGTARCGISSLFGLELAELKNVLENMLLSGLNGCEFSIENFFILKEQNQPISAIAAWIEGENVLKRTSSFIKSSLLSYYMPEEAMSHFNSLKAEISGFHFERLSGALQLEYLYCNPIYQGKGCARKLMEDVMNLFQVKQIELQVYKDNKNARRLYEKLGFRVSQELWIERNTIFPFDKKLVMIKTI